MKLFSSRLLLAALIVFMPQEALSVVDSRMPSQDTKVQRQRLNDVHFGEAVYSLYVDDPLTTLGRMAVAKQKGLEEAQLQKVTLLEGGVQLGYGMPKLAQENLSAQANSLLENNRPLAWYWLARLSFSHQRVNEGLNAHSAFSNAVKTMDADKYDLITPAQWFELNYEAAQGVLAMGGSDIATYVDALPQGHITRHYLQYNRAIDAYFKDNVLEAHHILEGLKQTLGENSGSAVDNSGWMSWFSWWQDNIDNGVEESETRALLNQVLLAEGQILLDLDRQEEALHTFDKINTRALVSGTDLSGERSVNIQHTFAENGQALLRDEALLHYGWGLAQSNDWPLALGVWDFLSKQETNLFTLQAIHALAYGYAQKGGEVQAYDTLNQLVNKLEVAIRQLDNLTPKISTDGYWKAVAKGAKMISEEIDADDKEVPLKEVNWDTLWPLSQHDLLAEIIVNRAGGEQDKLEQLLELYNIEHELKLQLSDAAIYSNLLDERDKTHAVRSHNVGTSDIEGRLNSLALTYQKLTERVEKTGQLKAKDDSEWLHALLTFANAEQREWYTRLERSEARLLRLAQERNMRPSYSVRLARLKGALIWQLAEQYQKMRWQSQRALKEVGVLLNQAAEAQVNFDALLNKPSLTEAQRERVSSVRRRIEEHLLSTRSLIASLENSLMSTAQMVIAERRAYLTQQRAQSKLAMLQLRDMNIKTPSPSSRSNKSGGE